MEPRGANVIAPPSGVSEDSAELSVGEAESSLVADGVTVLTKVEEPEVTVVAEGVAVAEALPLPLPAALVWVAAAPPVVVRKKSVTHFWLQSMYCCVSSSVPSPWGHLATHSVVWFTADSSGLGTEMHLAWQLTSLGSPVFRERLVSKKSQNPSQHRCSYFF